MERAVAKKLPEASILNLGKLPEHLKKYRTSIPTLMHGSKIEFGTIFGTKNYSMVRHVYFPLVMFRPLYSRALDLVIWTRISEKALRNLEMCGGFDEYMLSVDPEYIECIVAAMLRRKIALVYYGSRLEAEKILKQTTAKNFFLKHVDKEAVDRENRRIEIPPDGRLAAVRSKLLDNALISHGNDYVKDLNETFSVFDSHLARTARKELLLDPVLELIRKKREEWKIELSNEIDLKEFKCDRLKNY